MIELGAAASDETLLSVEDLSVSFPTDDGLVQAVRGITYDLKPREVLGIVGESGSGKSVASMALHGPAAADGADHRLDPVSRARSSSGCPTSRRARSAAGRSP